MRYENLLASRYIKAQKRQSVFTVISIASAIAIMAMIFILYSVFMNCFRKAVYTTSPYHLVLYELTEEQAELLENKSHIKSVSTEVAENGSTTAYVLFSSDVGDRDHWLQSIFIKTDYWKDYSLYHKWNETLMKLDRIGDGAQLWRLRIFCVFFIFAVVFAVALRLIVDTAFEISSKERVRHYGVLQSVGATPKQIVKIITCEGMRLCLIAIPFGLGTGVLLAYVMYKALLSAGLSDVIYGMTSDNFEMSFSVDPKMLFVAAAVGTVWVFLSAYGVGMRVIKKSPMEAITSRANDVKKVKKHTLSGLLFGISGSIASRNARRQKKRFFITVLTLTVSITMFSIFTTLTNTIDHGISNTISATYADMGDFNISLTNDTGISYSDTEKKLAGSGLFRDIRITAYAPFYTDHPNIGGGAIFYVNEEQYKALAGDGLPVTYEELVSSGGYILNVNYSEIRSIMDDDMLTITCEKYTKAESPNANPEEGNMNSFYDTEFETHKIRIIAEGASEMFEHAMLIGALPTYCDISTEWFGDIHYAATCTLRSAHEDSYTTVERDKILEFFENNSYTIKFEDEDDIYKEKLNSHNIISSIKAGGLILNFLIAIAALINLLNIISTGIANRRSELASLQCVGMTDRQLFRMTMIECLQFTATAAIFSAAICGLIMFGTETVLPRLLINTYADDDEALKETINSLIRLDHITPFVKILIGSAAAFAAGCAASFAMLRSQNTESLSDQIRGSEMKLSIKKHA